MFREMRRKKQLLSEAEDGPNLQTRNVGDPGAFRRRGLSLCRPVELCLFGRKNYFPWREIRA